MRIFLKSTMFLICSGLLINVNAQAQPIGITASEIKCAHEETERLLESNTGKRMQEDLQALGVKCGSGKQGEIIDLIMKRLLQPVISTCFKAEDDEYMQISVVETMPIIKSIALPRCCIYLDNIR